MILNKFKTLFWLLIGLLLVWQAEAQTGENSLTRRYSLAECVQFAIANHKNNINARVDEFIAEEKVKEYLSQGYPQVNGSIDVRYNAILPTQIIPAEALGGPKGQLLAAQFGTNWNSTVGFNGQQLLFDGTFFVGLQAAKEYVNLTKKSKQRTEVETATQVTKAYYSVLINEQRLNLLKNAINQLDALYKNTKALFDNGFAEQLDLDRISVNLNNTRTELDKAQKLVDLSRILLKFQMGMNVNENLVLTDQINTNDLTNVFSDTLAVPSPESRIEYAVLTKSIQLNEMNVKRLRVGYYPSVYLYGSLQTQAQRMDFDLFDTQKRWYPISVVGLEIRMGIFDGFRRKAQVQQARLEREKIENELKDFRNVVNLEYMDARTRLVNGLKNLEIQKRNLDLAQKVYQHTGVKYKEGIGTNIEVINADIEFKNAQNNYINALMESYLARVDLQKALGTLYRP